MYSLPPTGVGEKCCLAEDVGYLGVVHPEGGSSMCCACVGGGRVVPPFPVPSPCSGMGMVLGTDASFREGFMSVTEARIIAGTRSGGSCSTNCGELHPPAWACQSRAQVSGFLGGLWGGPSPRVCCWSQQMRVG